MQCAATVFALFHLILCSNFIDSSSKRNINNSVLEVNAKRSRVELREKQHTAIDPIFGADCQHIIKGIPIKTELIVFLNKNLTEISQLLLKECLGRFNELYAQKDLMTKQIYNYTIDDNLTSNKPSDLIVLDMDETLLDQRSFGFDAKYCNFIDSFDSFSMFNNNTNNDLMFNFNLHYYSNPVNGGYQTLSPNLNHLVVGYANIAIFRKHLMEFIYLTQHQPMQIYDIILYSSAISKLVIHHAITIELYYNYVYKHYTDQRFKFKFIISRSNDNQPIFVKSVDTVMNLLHKCCHKEWRNYQNIIIADDQTDKVWSNSVSNSFWTTNKCVIAVNVPRFSLLHHARSKLETIHYRDNDLFLSVFGHFIQRFDSSNSNKYCWPYNHYQELIWTNL